MLKKRNIKKLLRMGSLCLFLLGCSEESFLVQTKEESDQAIEEEMQHEEQAVMEKDVALREEKEDTAEIAVHICGAVNQPGLYFLEENPRLYEGIQKAGGFREDAEEDYLNQAMMLEDGMKIVVPTREEVLKAEEEKVGDTDSGNIDNVQNIADGYVLSKIMTEEQAVEDGYIQKKDMVQTTGEEKAEETKNHNEKVNLNTADEALLCTLPGIGESRAKSIIAYRQEHGPFQKPEDIMKVSGIKQAAYDKIKDYVFVSD